MAELAIVPEWLTNAGPFPCPDPNTQPGPPEAVPRPRVVEGVRVHVFEQLDTAAAGLLALAHTMRPDVLHHHHSNHAELAHFIADRIGVPVVYTAHLPFGDPEVDKHKGVVNPAVRAAMLRSDRFIVFVESGRERVARWLSEAAAKTRVVGHGIDDRPNFSRLSQIA